MHNYQTPSSVDKLIDVRDSSHVLLTNGNSLAGDQRECLTGRGATCEGQNATMEQMETLHLRGIRAANHPRIIKALRSHSEQGCNLPEDGQIKLLS